MTVNEVRLYLDKSIATFDGDPPDNQFQRGYLAALHDLRSDLFSTRQQRAAAAKRKAKP